MKKLHLLILFLSISGFANSQDKQIIETIDIENFWRAFDKLSNASSKKDSISIIQTEYIDNSTEFFKEFIKVRNFNAEEYNTLIAKYPRFWNSIRPETENVQNRKYDVEQLLDKYEKEIPNFKRPNVCFAIGCLRTGGTVSKNLILIGTEIAASTPDTEKSELSGWLKSVIGTFGDIESMVSHETVHTQQKKGRLSDLVDHTLNEGVADFLSEKISGLTINKVAYKYGSENDCFLRKEFLADYSKNKTDISNWLYNGSRSKDRPADLGYYIGYRIAEEYYYKSTNKKKAVGDLLNRKNYKKIFKKSEYLRKSCS
ncbi:gliding motility protein GldB-related protein [Belliella pelovolcani]|uniref:Predicted Zn-dependent protease n=1 Tax=Belliella pelovolcani TaxID=529505 RepID=A0A1N7NWF9_9BACT|nr:DUF2268 domain-containing putative Zn-dependent protease [Belliella pelovolcani]SIT02632.1 Predicted Zn-dependent protease [Belliella pelovolcani]